MSGRARLAVAAAVLLVTLAGCAVDPTPPQTDPWRIDGPARDLPPALPRAEGRPGPNGGTVLQPASVPIEHGAAYRFSLGHCGLLSPIDVDNSFWEPVDGVAAGGGPLDLETDPEMINQTEGEIAVVGDEMRFRTAGGSLARFTRHRGEREFPGCD